MFSSERWIGVVLVALVLVLIALGRRIDAGGFWGNLIAEVVGILLSIMVATVLVDRLAERQRHRRC